MRALPCLLVSLSLFSCGGTVCVVDKNGSQTCDEEGESNEDKTCEEVADDLVEELKSILAACGLPAEVTDAPVLVCDEAMKQTLLCYGDCSDLLTCGAINGEDLDALTAYGDCTLACGSFGE